MTQQYNYVHHGSIDGGIQILNSELAKVSEWCDSNKLTLSVNNTQMLMLSRKKNPKPKVMSSYLMKQYKE